MARNCTKVNFGKHSQSGTVGRTGNLVRRRAQYALCVKPLFVARTKNKYIGWVQHGSDGSGFVSARTDKQISHIVRHSALTLTRRHAKRTLPRAPCNHSSARHTGSAFRFPLSGQQPCVRACCGVVWCGVVLCCVVYVCLVCCMPNCMSAVILCAFFQEKLESMRSVLNPCQNHQSERSVRDPLPLQ